MILLVRAGPVIMEETAGIAKVILSLRLKAGPMVIRNSSKLRKVKFRSAGEGTVFFMNDKNVAGALHAFR